MKVFKEKIISLRAKYVDIIRLGSPHNILGITNVPCNAASDTFIVGFDGSEYSFDCWDDDGIWRELTRIGISKKYQNQGLETALLNYIIKEAERFNITGLRLIVGKKTIQLLLYMKR